MSETGNGYGGNDSGAPVLQEEEDDDDDDDDRLGPMVVTTCGRTRWMTSRGVDGDDALHAGRVGLFEFCEVRRGIFLSTSRALAFESCWTPTPMASPIRETGALELPDVGAVMEDRHVEVEAVTRDDRAAELRLVDPEEVHERALRVERLARVGEQAPYLRERLQDRGRPA